MLFNQSSWYLYFSEDLYFIASRNCTPGSAGAVLHRKPRRFQEQRKSPRLMVLEVFGLIRLHQCAQGKERLEEQPSSLPRSARRNLPSAAVPQPTSSTCSSFWMWTRYNSKTVPRSPPLETCSRRSVCGGDRLLPPICLMKHLSLSLSL
jgi:hypothetical protein